LHHTNACCLPLRLLFCVQTRMHLSTCLVCTQVTPRLQLLGWHDMCMAACRLHAQHLYSTPALR
jgi:hypothetical protein